MRVHRRLHAGDVAHPDQVHLLGVSIGHGVGDHLLLVVLVAHPDAGRLKLGLLVGDVALEVDLLSHSVGLGAVLDRSSS